MSIVACKVYGEKIEIASDSINVRGCTMQDDQNMKLSTINDIIIGGVGLTQDNSLMFHYCKTHTPKDATTDSVLTFIVEFSEWIKKRTDTYGTINSYIMVFKGKAFYIARFYVNEIIDYQAIGAGKDFALSALYLGHDAKKAVETACKLSVYCALPAELITINMASTKEPDENSS